MKRTLPYLVFFALIGAFSFAYAANNYRISNPGGVVTTLKSTDTAGVHVPHVNVDTMAPSTPSSSSTYAVTNASSTAAGSNLVLKASAGNLYSLAVTIAATSGYLMLFDATSLPSNGAVTPIFCYPITSNGTNGGVALEFVTPKPFATGITAGFSTTGCFTLTASATANFFGGYK